MKILAVETTFVPFPISTPVGIRPGLPTGLAGVLVEQVLKLDLVLLVSGGVDVRDIVGNHVEVELLGLSVAPE